MRISELKPEITTGYKAPTNLNRRDEVSVINLAVQKI